MVRELSTAISDTAVALSAFNSAWRLRSIEPYAALGFLIIGSAASLGVLRFSQVDASDSLIGWHKYMAWVSACIGIPLISLSYLRQAGYIWFANGHLAASVATVIMKRFLSEEITKPCGDILGGAGVISILFCSIRDLNEHGILGTVAYASASLAVGTEGWLWGFKRVDIFHYLLAVGNIALMIGLSGSSSPIFYKPKAIW